MAERGDSDIWSRVSSRSACLRNELETLEQIRRHFEREINASKYQGDAGEKGMLRKALGEIEAKIETVRSRLNELEGN